jgi:NADH dehydrogenase
LHGQENVQVVFGRVHSVDLEARTLLVRDRPVPYDWLVVASGVTQAYFGNDSWRQRAPGLKTLEDALEIRRRILLAFEEAELEDDPEARAAQLTFVIVGGGPTGVELAGALREIATRTIPKDFRRVDTSTARVILIEGEDRLLPGMSVQASEAAKRQLEELGVDVRVRIRVTGMNGEGVQIGDETLPAASVIWAAGVQGSRLAETLGVGLDRQGRVLVEPDCSLPDHPEAFVIGDLAALTDPLTAKPVPGVAQAAIQMGRFVGDIIRTEVQGGDPKEVRPPFHYVDKGTMATIGRARAVADMGDVTFKGAFAWFLWSTVHILYLIGFRNRVMVMVNWAWQWALQTRGARLITGSPAVALKEPADL